MSRTSFGAAGELSFSGKEVTYVIVAAAIALVALGFAAALVKAVLATGKGTQKMQDIAGAVQEGAQAYLIRQFKTLGVFVVIAVVLLFLLPVSETSGGDLSIKIGRSLFFVVGAAFSAFIGGIGVLVAIVGVFITRLRPSDKSGMTAINRAFFISATISAILVAIASFIVLPSEGGNIPVVHMASDVRFGLLHGRFVGAATILNFYVLHCVGFPLIASFLIALHFWRVRKDGGISGPL